MEQRHPVRPPLDGAAPTPGADGAGLVLLGRPAATEPRVCPAALTQPGATVVVLRTAGPTAVATPVPRRPALAPGARAREDRAAVAATTATDATDTAAATAVGTVQPPRTRRADASVAGDHRAGGRHRRVTFRRTGRPALYLAAAVVGASGFGLLTAGDKAAHADPAAGAAPDPGSATSVADALGLRADRAPTVSDTEAAAQLQQLAASRAQRETAQVQAAQTQAAADQAVLDAQAAAAAAAAEAARPAAVDPVPGARLTSTYGDRWGRLHGGLDLAAPMRTPEYAAMGGVVLQAGPASGFGLAVYIQHDNGDVTVYGHMDEILVSAGQVVQAGDLIALVGNRGQSTGPHLHFEVRAGGMDGEKIDPQAWLAERGVQL